MTDVRNVGPLVGQGRWTIATMAVTAVLLASAYTGRQAELNREQPVATSAVAAPIDAAR